jgi:hypothetical protein
MRERPALADLEKEGNMDREHDQEVVCERGERTPVEPRDPSGGTTGADAVEIRKPPLLEVTTPNGRVWFLVNLN